MTLKYKKQCYIHDMIDCPTSPWSMAEKLEMLQRHAQAWNTFAFEGHLHDIIEGPAIFSGRMNIVEGHVVQLTYVETCWVVTIRKLGAPHRGIVPSAQTYELSSAIPQNAFFVSSPSQDLLLYLVRR
jgi:hypothetical protein